jgi:glycosyltransferase involved in cell wall biosynthesis
MTGVKVVLVEQLDPIRPSMGGGEVYTNNLLKYLGKRGVEVCLVGVSYDDGNPSSDIIFTSPFKFVPIVKKTTISSYEYFLRLILRAPHLRIPSSTIIHAQRPDYLFPFALFFRKNPKVVTLHGNPLKRLNIQTPWITRFIYTRVEAFSLKRSDLIIAVDQGTKDFYQHRYPWLAPKIKVIPVGIDTDKFKVLDKNLLRQKYGFKAKDRMVIYVGRLGKEKNLDFLIECFAQVVTVIPNATLVLVGDGKERGYLESLVKKFALTQVIFMGAQNPDTVPEIINCADVLALCSFTEGSPTVIREALACGVPVISVDVGDVLQIVRNEKMGQIVARDKELFSAALVNALSKGDDETVRLARSEFASRFGFNQIGKDLMKLYEEVLVSRGC